MRFAFSVFLALLLCIGSSAYAAPEGTQEILDPPGVYAGAHTNPLYAAPKPIPEYPKTPDLISIGGAWMDFDKTEKFTNSADYRFEYRFGYSFIGGDELGFHPFLAYETTSRSVEYGLGGFAMDWNFLGHGIFTWSEGMGYLDSGDHRSFGGTFQFRSQAEVGYRFDNNMRLTAEFSHISNAKLTRVTPGAEIAGIYLHIPTTMLFGYNRAGDLFQKNPY